MTKNNHYHYKWEEFGKDAVFVIDKLKSLQRDFNGVFAPPRGGLPLGVMVSHHLEIPLLSAPIDKDTLIVDDIADTGKTLEEFIGKNFIATLFYHKQSIVTPDIWIKEKEDDWIIFPWEKLDS